MSIAALKHVVENSTASGGALALLLVLAWHANSDGRAYPAISTLAKETRCTPRSVQRQLRELEVMGCIKTQSRMGHRSTYIVALTHDASVALTALTHDASVTPDAYVTPDKTGTGPLTKQVSTPDASVTQKTMIASKIDNKIPPCSSPQAEKAEPSAKAPGQHNEDDDDDDRSEIRRAAETASVDGHPARVRENGPPENSSGACGGGSAGDAGDRRAGAQQVVPLLEPKPPRGDRQAVAKRRQQFPGDWWPTPAGEQFALDRGCPDIAANVANCIDTHGGKGTVFADHDAAWRTWCNNAQKWGWATGPGVAGQTSHANGGIRGGYSNAGDRARQASDRMSAAATRIAAEWDERDRARADEFGPDAMPVTNFATWRRS